MGQAVRDWVCRELRFVLRSLQKYLDNGWADAFKTWQEVVDAVGTSAQLTPVACIIKQAHGREKVRLVVDMRRSAVNGLMDVRERVVLPRISDVAKGAKALAGYSDHELEFLCCDFQDAFLTMLAHPDERPFIVVKDALGRYVAIKVCAFGLASAPLLWCRLSSMAMRLAQACSEDHEARSHCFIDDPLVAVSAPTVRRRTKIMARFLLLWCVLGFKISWHKVCRGTTLDWIGVQLCVLGQVPTHLESHAF